MINKPPEFMTCLEEVQQCPHVHLDGRDFVSYYLSENNAPLLYPALRGWGGAGLSGFSDFDVRIDFDYGPGPNDISVYGFLWPYEEP